MWSSVIRLFILLTVMLNHAVMACDALVVHMPDHEHAYTSYIYESHTASSEHHLTTADSTTDEHHSAHAHVTCAISYIHSVNLLSAGTTPRIAPTHGVSSKLFAAGTAP